MRFDGIECQFRRSHHSERIATDKQNHCRAHSAEEQLRIFGAMAMAMDKLLQFLALATVLWVCSEASYGLGHPNALLRITLPKIYLGDFEYAPTQEGYRFSYQLIDGTRRTEVGIIPGAANSNAYKSDPRLVAERTRARQRSGTKNRKLSPKSLQSLAG